MALLGERKLDNISFMGLGGEDTVGLMGAWKRDRSGWGHGGAAGGGNRARQRHLAKREVDGQERGEWRRDESGWGRDDATELDRVTTVVVTERGTNCCGWRLRC